MAILRSKEMNKFYKENINNIEAAIKYVMNNILAQKYLVPFIIYCILYHFLI